MANPASPTVLCTTIGWTSTNLETIVVLRRSIADQRVGRGTKHGERREAVSNKQFRNLYAFAM
jgi:hypothetical protein